uniref:acid phosphatase n=1 Tax=Clastoptera arizonana TaxID=38151 RepID=A0A1B6D2U7_9HEMI
MSCDLQLSDKQINVCKFSCVILTIIVIALAINLNSSDCSHYTPSLKLVIAITRHGVRAPAYDYPTNPYSSKAHWPNGAGELTSLGKMQMYKLGTKFREIYNGFLNENYVSSEFRSFSTLIERTMQSAEALLAGLYPPKSYQIWNNDLAWQPIPVFPNYLDKEKIATTPELCPAFTNFQKTAIKLAENKSAESSKIIEYMLRNSGFNTSSMFHLYVLWDVLTCQKYSGLELPEWAKEVYPAPFKDVYKTPLYAFLIGNDEMVRLLAGPMVNSFIESMQKKMNDTQNKERKMLFYSSHDNTLLAILTSFGFKNIEPVQFAMTILLELHSNSLTPSGYEIKLFFIDGTTEDRTPIQKDIPTCNSPCDFNRFFEITNIYHKDLDFDKECLSKQ